MLSCILENLHEFHLDLNLLFIDFNLAYDSVSTTHLYEILKESEILNKLANSIKMMLLDSN